MYPAHLRILSAITESLLLVLDSLLKTSIYGTNKPSPLYGEI